MTPLLNAIYKDSLKPEYRRKFNDMAGVYELIDSDLHPFDVTKIDDPIRKIMVELGSGRISKTDDVRLNSPADKVWIEGMDASGRVGLLVDNRQDVFICCSNRASVRVETLPKEDKELATFYYGAAIYLINCPKHTKNIYKSKSIRARRKSHPKFHPPDCWNEVRLVVDNEVVEFSASGDSHRKMPYHFVRGHIRPSLGNKWVEPYWRGNKELGVVRTRHKCVTS